MKISHNNLSNIVYDSLTNVLYHFDILKDSERNSRQLLESSSGSVLKPLGVKR